MKRLPLNVRRQHNIENYIVDFYISEKKTVIEVDGTQHASRENAELDAKRDKELSKWGIQVFRYTNESIRKNFNAVTADILDKLNLNFSDLKNL